MASSKAIVPITSLALLCSLASAASAVTIPVSNPSFEVTGAPRAQGGGWYRLPDPATTTTSKWVSGTGYGSDFALHREANGHMNPAIDGDYYANLSAVNPLSQDLQTTVQPGDAITLSFYGGRSPDTTNAPGGKLTAAISVGGVELISQQFDFSTQAVNTWVQKSLQGTATTAGNLSISFTNNSGVPFLDAVSVDVVPEPASAALLGLGGLALLVRRRVRTR